MGVNKGKAESEPLPITGTDFLDALQEAIGSDIGGEVVIKCGEHSGRVYTTRGEIAWVIVSTRKQTFFHRLVEKELASSDVLNAVYQECRQNGRNFGEMLIEWDVLNAEMLRKELLGHIADNMVELLSWQPVQTMFIAQNRKYKGSLTYPLSEVMAEVERQERKAGSGQIAKIIDLGAGQTKARSAKNGGTWSKVSEEQRAQAVFALDAFGEVDGLLTAGLVSGRGDVVAEVLASELGMSDLAKLAIRVSQITQVETSQVGIEACNFIHLATPSNSVLVRCLSQTEEASLADEDFSFLVVVHLDVYANLALVKIRLEAVFQKILTLLRAES